MRAALNVSERMNKRVVIGAFICAGIVGGAYFSGLHELLTFERVQSAGHRLIAYVQNNYWWSVFLYFLTFIVGTIGALPVGILLSVLAGFLFGTIFGTFYAVLAATLGQTIIFIGLRYFFTDWVQQKYSDELVWFNREVESKGGRYIILMQILPITPTALLAAVAALSPMPLIKFFGATFAGLIPGTLIYVLAGNKLYEADSLQSVMSPLIVFVLILSAACVALSLFWQRTVQA